VLVVRYAVAALLGLVVLVGAMLLVRPLIFSLAPERGDDNYAVAALSELSSGPIERQLLLNRSHAIPGEQPNGARVQIQVIVSQPPVGGIAVVKGWSETGRCAVTIAGDRLRDCRGSTWTMAGVPISPGAPLRRFPASVRAGAVVVDFTEAANAG
jgi:hypothetical protein